MGRRFGVIGRDLDVRHQPVTFVAVPDVVFGAGHVHHVGEVGVDAPVQEVDAILITMRSDGGAETRAEPEVRAEGTIGSEPNDRRHQPFEISPIQVAAASRDPLFLVGIEMNQTHFFLNDVHAVMAVIERVIDTLKVVEVPLGAFRCTSFPNVSCSSGQSDLQQMP